MEEIRNQNVREYAEGFLNLCSEMGDSSTVLLFTHLNTTLLKLRHPSLLHPMLLFKVFVQLIDESFRDKAAKVTLILVPEVDFSFQVILRTGGISGGRKS